MSFSFSGKFKDKDAARQCVAHAHAPGSIKAFVFDCLVPLREPAADEHIELSCYGHQANHASDSGNASVIVKLSQGAVPV